MRPMKQRTAAEGATFHAEIPVRIYEGDSAHGERIRVARELIAQLLEPDASIVELGCGTADISGHFAADYKVTGYDCNPKSLGCAAKRFPEGNWQRIDSLEAVSPHACDVLVLCEVLEHLPHPEALVKAWLPLARYVLISHPLNEALDCTLSAGEHQWSFDGADFGEWFRMGGHTLLKYRLVPCGCYTMIVGVGENLSK